MGLDSGWSDKCKPPLPGWLPSPALQIRWDTALGGCPGRGGRGTLSACPPPKAIAFPLLSPGKDRGWCCWELTGFQHIYWGAGAENPVRGTPKGRGKCTGRGTGHKGITCDLPNPTTAPGIGVFRHRHPGWITISPPSSLRGLPRRAPPLPRRGPGSKQAPGIILVLRRVLLPRRAQREQELPHHQRVHQLLPVAASC